MKFKIDKFVIGILISITLAYFFSNWGSDKSPIPLDLISTVGISFIFFFYGLKLSVEKIKTGLKNWKLHLLIQLTTFVLFPLLIIPFYPLMTTESSQQMWLAFMFLAALPSTVSSSVVMVSIAKGNIPAAIFNASISGLIGIVITPLWMGLFLSQQSSDFDLTSIYTKLLLQILLPVILGLVLQKYFGHFVQKNTKYLSMYDKSIILLIIFKSFSQSFEDQIFEHVKWIELGLLFILVLSLFFIVYFVTAWLSKRLGFSSEDQITAQFCGTKKSLVHGTVFSKFVFPPSMPLGVIFLPIMLFHASQIFIISIIADQKGKRT